MYAQYLKMKAAGKEEVSLAPTWLLSKSPHYPSHPSMNIERETPIQQLGCLPAGYLPSVHYLSGCVQTMQKFKEEIKDASSLA